MRKKKRSWRKLDNSAKIFPISGNRKYSTVFRYSVVLYDMVDPELLQKAVYKALIKYKKFNVRMRAGLFWYYFEDNPQRPIVSEELTYPCKYIDPRMNNDYLFKVTYYRNKINIDIFHSLTDGDGGMVFFKEIVYSYLELAHPELLNVPERQDKAEEIDYDVKDSYIDNFDKKAEMPARSSRAYLLKGKEIKLGATSAIHFIINNEDLKKECSKYDISVTKYLTAVLIYSIYKANYLKYCGNKKAKKPIRVCIPVNLKNYFKSKTMSNFFSYVTINADINKLADFDRVVELVRDEYDAKLNEEELTKTMAMTVRIGHNFMISVLPIFIKKAILKLGYRYIQKYMTITFSNVGRMGMIGDYQKFIDYFLLLIAPENIEKIKCSGITFENKMAMSFTSVLRDSDIERHFCEFLRNRGVEIQIESNEVNDLNLK